MRDCCSRVTRHSRRWSGIEQHRAAWVSGDPKGDGACRSAGAGIFYGSITERMEHPADNSRHLRNSSRTSTSQILPQSARRGSFPLRVHPASPRFAPATYYGRHFESCGQESIRGCHVEKSVEFQRSIRKSARRAQHAGKIVRKYTCQSTAHRTNSTRAGSTTGVLARTRAE